MAPEARNVASEAGNVASEAGNVALEAGNVASEAENVASEAGNVDSEAGNGVQVLKPQGLFCFAGDTLNRELRSSYLILLKKTSYYLGPTPHIWKV